MSSKYSDGQVRTTCQCGRSPMNTDERSMLSRVNLNNSLEEFLSIVSGDYALGDLLDYELIHVGYEDLNVWIQTSDGYFVMKVFSKSRTYPAIESYIKG